MSLDLRAHSRMRPQPRIGPRNPATHPAYINHTFPEWGRDFRLLEEVGGGDGRRRRRWYQEVELGKGRKSPGKPHQAPQLSGAPRGPWSQGPWFIQQLGPTHLREPPDSASALGGTHAEGDRQQESLAQLGTAEAPRGSSVWEDE